MLPRISLPFACSFDDTTKQQQLWYKSVYINNFKLKKSRNSSYLLHHCATLKPLTMLPCRSLLFSSMLHNWATLKMEKIFRCQFLLLLWRVWKSFIRGSCCMPLHMSKVPFYCEHWLLKLLNIFCVYSHVLLMWYSDHIILYTGNEYSE